VKGVVIGGPVYQSAANRAYSERLVSTRDALGLANVVTFTGFTPHVATVLDAADVVVHPPIRPEPFGLAVLEAGALRKPLVVSAAGGPLEIVEDGVTGILVPPGDVASFSDAVAALAGDRSRRLAMGDAAHAAVVNRFSPQAHVKAVESVFGRVVDAST
jgi:glycosyltransferase involved in cell wall biosynthesis